MKLMIETETFIFRPLRLGDYEMWKLTLSNLPLAQNEWDEGPWDLKFLTKKEFQKILLEQKKLRDEDKTYEFVVLDKRTKQWIGFISIMDISRGIFQNGYLGYRVFSPYWGNGIGKLLVQIGMKIAFEKLSLHRIEAGISPKNKRSIRVAEKAKLRFEGISKRRLKVNNKWKDMMIFAKTAEEKY